MLAEVAISNELAFTVVGGLVSALVALFWLGVKHYDAQLDDLRSQRDSYRNMAEEAVKNIEELVNADRLKKGKPPFDKLAPIVAEHSSPTTEAARDTADVGTMRARLVAANLAMGIEAEKEQADEGNP